MGKNEEGEKIMKAKVVYKPDGKVEGVLYGTTTFCMNNKRDSEFFVKVLNKHNRPHLIMKAVFAKYNGIKRFKDNYKKYPLIDVHKKQGGPVIRFYDKNLNIKYEM